MSTVTADQKRRVSLPEALPGDVFDVRRTAEGNYVLEKLIRPPTRGRYSAEEVQAAMQAAPLQCNVRWDELRRLTREA